MLHLISQQFPKEAFILYRDDGMAAVMGGKQEMERWKKKLYSLFQGLDLRITVEGGSKVIDFLHCIAIKMFAKLFSVSPWCLLFGRSGDKGNCKTEGR